MSSPSNLPSQVQQIFTDEEQVIWQTLIKSEVSAAETIPDNLPASELWSYLRVVTRGLGKAQQAISRLKPFLGRILILIKQHPHLYEQHGYQTYSDFMSHGVPAMFGVSRPEAFNCAKVAEQLQFLPANQMEKMGFSMLNSLSTAIKRSTQDGMPVEMVQAKRDFWVAQATSGITVKQFQEKMEDAAVIANGEMDRVTIVLLVTPDMRKRWNEFVAQPEIQAYCNCETPEGILERMLEECEPHWLATANDALRQ
jgi:hypothetical protein